MNVHPQPARKVKLAASVMCADLLHLQDQVRSLEMGGVDWLHFDIMDAHFVPNLTLGPDLLRAVRRITSLPLDAHLMVEDPDQLIPPLVEAGAQIISVHLEACPHLDRTLRLIESFGALPMVALNPATPLSSLQYALDQAKAVLLMTVNPGFAGQALVPGALGKIARLREMLAGREIEIQVDGNVSYQHAPAMVAAGATVLVCGTSSIFLAGADPGREALRFRAHLQGKVRGER